MNMKMKSSRILLICPRYPHRWSVGMMLCRLGHQVFVARNLPEGVERTRACQFDLVVLQDELKGSPGSVTLRDFLDESTRRRTLVFTRESEPYPQCRRRYPEVREIMDFPERPEELAAAVCEVLIMENYLGAPQAVPEAQLH